MKSVTTNMKSVIVATLHIVQYVAIVFMNSVAPNAVTRMPRLVFMFISAADLAPGGCRAWRFSGSGVRTGVQRVSGEQARRPHGEYASARTAGEGHGRRPRDNGASACSPSREDTTKGVVLMGVR